MNPLFHAASAALLFENPLPSLAGGFALHGGIDVLIGEGAPAINPDDPSSWKRFAWWLLYQIGGCVAIGVVTGRWWAVLGGGSPRSPRCCVVWL